MEELTEVVEQRDYIGAIVFMSSHVCVCIDENKHDELVFCMHICVLMSMYIYVITVISWNESTTTVRLCLCMS